MTWLVNQLSDFFLPNRWFFNFSMASLLLESVVTIESVATIVTTIVSLFLSSYTSRHHRHLTFLDIYIYVRQCKKVLYKYRPHSSMWSSNSPTTLGLMAIKPSSVTSARLNTWPGDRRRPICSIWSKESNGIKIGFASPTFWSRLGLQKTFLKFESRTCSQVVSFRMTRKVCALGSECLTFK